MARLPPPLPPVAVSCSALQYVAVCCRVLQCVHIHARLEIMHMHQDIACLEYLRNAILEYSSSRIICLPRVFLNAFLEYTAQASRHCVSWVLLNAFLECYCTQIRILCHLYDVLLHTEYYCTRSITAHESGYCVHILE